MDKILGCVCLRRTSYNEVDHYIGRGTSIQHRRGLSVEEFFEMERFEPLQDYVNVRRAHREIVLFSKRISWPSRRS